MADRPPQEDATKRAIGVRHQQVRRRLFDKQARGLLKKLQR
jgi:hypothetical protein